ncbi:toll/interleukin-1 receptor domain-containing protein [Haloarchaeobius amylolyticus]|uniref:toll/interleukin-1 receptor domain-containing protein n=1 Tax=Haloarchaeobius amylolyticus TaxID=1198296 RepID=UPI002270EF8C|nr:toll/interleukin-1 receptor domain-containing protein [Haloarchaeobius amylolyticus]
MDRDVFLSHSSEDADVATDICQGLEARGIDVWMAPRDIPGGKEWTAAILDGIDSCEGIVFLSSEHAYDSAQTKREIQHASDDKPIIPVRLDDTSAPAHFRFYLSHIQWIEAGQSPDEEVYEELADAVVEACADVTRSLPEDSAADDDSSGEDDETEAGSEEEDPSPDIDPAELRELVEILDAEQAHIADEVANAMERQLGETPIDLRSRSREFVADLRAELEAIDVEDGSGGDGLLTQSTTDAETLDGYVVTFSVDGDAVKTMSGQNQSEAMRQATDYLIRKHGLVEAVDEIPWVPGNKKAILNNSTEWEHAVTQYYELESGYYLDTKLSKRGKQRELERMADRCDLSVSFTGEW